MTNKAESLDAQEMPPVKKLADRDAVIASIGELSVNPRVIRLLSVALKHPDADLTPAVMAMKTESVLTAAMLAACNSPTHYRGQRLVALEPAVLRLGLRETYRITLFITFRQGLRVSNLPDNRAADYLWSRAVTAACAMEMLTSATEVSPAAYTIGLLHAIGCFIIARNGSTLEGYDNTHPAALARAQEAAHGIAYPEAGAVALRQWDFPAEIWVPIRYQLSPQHAPEYQEQAKLLARAISIAQFIEECRPESPVYRESASADVFVNRFIQDVEAHSLELLECFYTRRPERPKWAKSA